MTFYARVGNLSEGGLFLRTSTPLKTGARAELRLGPSEVRQIHASATVMWTCSDDGMGTPGMGLQFDAMEAPALDLLRGLIHTARGSPESLET